MPRTLGARLKKRKLLLAVGLIISIFLATSVVFRIINNRIPDTPKLPEPPLKTLGQKRNIQLGNFAIPVLLNEKPYRDILTSQFDFVLIDNQPNWHFTDYDLRPSEKEFDFSRIDEVVNFAEKNNMGMQIHHYIWGEEKWLPNWLLKGNYSEKELLDIIHNHISTLGQRYSGKAQEWTVVNEAFTRKQHVFGLNDWWGERLDGTDYIDKSFIWARQADPYSKLILNDFNNEGINDISNAMYDYVKSAKSRGVPIDGIGMQMHIDGSHPPTKNEVISNMKRFAELGVKVYVTEFDVNMHDVKAGPKQKDQTQANIYYDMMRACIESQVCPSFAMLGITDKETWYNHIGLSDPRPLPFDKKYNPKPAFYSFRYALEQSD